MISVWAPFKRPSFGKKRYQEINLEPTNFSIRYFVWQFFQNKAI
ncbi:hypothetical protein J690_3344 [Acinetobacter sp. 742879]|nr:hypothetical protein M211_0304 [Acinetobacter lactucae]EXC26429.1 hypothetical protein J536_2999 [Acinetobacter sp. 809848]EXR38526.1 hypothetical protein J655_3374 [Acinetobacter sp. 1294243]EXS11358.1 hypothetical protein J672_3678 [Acinetobacter sp. 883425]EXS23673.1 hypothetical protein J658_1482 [Acinetobacter baumannii 573719]EXS26115.1 hypothetical protein J690_3344 [Acinetobacter sp. 742879]WHA52475.1 hypothetical protein OH685_04390 [Acinetobacter pittii]